MIIQVSQDPALTWHFIPIATVTVAALTVIFSSVTSFLVAKAQIKASARLAEKQIAAAAKQAADQVSAASRLAEAQIIKPMRQAWINNLRDLLAEITALSVHFSPGVGQEARAHSQLERIQLLQFKITLMLHKGEADHDALVEQLVVLISKATTGEIEGFIQARKKVEELSLNILRREWVRVKETLSSSVG